MSTSSHGNANQGDSDGSWEYAPDYLRSPLPPLPLPTSSASEGDSDDPALEINDMKNKLEHDSSLVHYWTQKCVGAEQKLAYLTRQQSPRMDIHLQPKMDPKVRVAHNYCKHGDVHDHPCGTCRDLFDVGPDNVQYCRLPTPSPPKPPSPIVCITPRVVRGLLQ
ncbi:hypothetical protein ACE6H2_015558 [Prunus campanulata]